MALGQPSSNTFTEINITSGLTINGTRQTTWPSGAFVQKAGDTMTGELIGTTSTMTTVNDATVNSGTINNTNAITTGSLSSTTNVTTAEGVFTNGVTLNGTRITSWPSGSSPSFFNKTCWFWSPNGSGSSISTFGNGSATTAAGSGSGVTTLSATATAPTYAVLSTGTTTNGYTIVGDSGTKVRNNKPCKLVWRGLLSNTNGVQVYLGITELAAAMIVDNNFGASRRCVWIQYISQQSPFWQVISANGTSATNVVTSIVADSSEHTFEMDYSNTSVTSFIDGTSVATNTLFIPTTVGFLSEAAIGNITNGVSAKLQIVQFYAEQDF